MTDRSPRPRQPGWRTLPDNISIEHLRRMDLREPHLIAEVEPGRWVTAVVPDRVRWSIGRGDGSDLAITWDGSVSRSQAIIERMGTLLVLEDSGFSRNGTLVGGKRILGRTRLNDLDEITCGNCVLVVRLPPVPHADAATISVGRSSAARAANLELTPAERRVVDALLPPPGGADPLMPVPTNRQVADTLDIGVETVKSHLKSITQKLVASGVRGPIDRSRLADLAAQGLLETRDTSAGT